MFGGSQRKGVLETHSWNSVSALQLCKWEMSSLFDPGLTKGCFNKCGVNRNFGNNAQLLKKENKFNKITLLPFVLLDICTA